VQLVKDFCLLDGIYGINRTVKGPGQTDSERLVDDGRLGPIWIRGRRKAHAQGERATLLFYRIWKNSSWNSGLPLYLGR
jgi:hypothetical protein